MIVGISTISVDMVLLVAQQWVEASRQVPDAIDHEGGQTSRVGGDSLVCGLVAAAAVSTIEGHWSW